jgi:hypothetical protein
LDRRIGNIGYWCGLAAFTSTVAYDVVQILQVAGQRPTTGRLESGIYLRKMRSVVHGTLIDRPFTSFFLLEHIPVLDKDFIPEPEDVR